MTPIVSFIGKSNSGKTTLLKQVIREMKSRGYSVGAIKHTHHDFGMDQPGKDSWQLAQAGSDAVAISGPGKVAVMQQVEEELTIAQIAALFKCHLDIILAEGFKGGDTAKILVQGPATEHFNYDDNLLAIVSPEISSNGRPEFDDEVIENIIELLIQQIGHQQLDKQRAEYAINKGGL